jgi:uncharacterized OsmC-like protein
MQNQHKLQAQPLNGVNTAGLIATVDLVEGQPELAQFQFRAYSEWIEGAHTRTSIIGFSGAGKELKHERSHFADTDQPIVLCGEDRAPAPVEWLLHGLAGCLLAGIASEAASRGIRLAKVKCSVSGDIDLSGMLGTSHKARNGFTDIMVTFDISGDAPRGELEALVAHSRERSAVFDILTTGVPISMNVRTQH